MAGDIRGERVTELKGRSRFMCTAVVRIRVAAQVKLLIKLDSRRREMVPVAELRAARDPTAVGISDLNVQGLP